MDEPTSQEAHPISEPAMDEQTIENAIAAGSKSDDIEQSFVLGYN